MPDYLTSDSLCDTMGDPFDDEGNLNELGMETLADLEERGQLI